MLREDLNEGVFYVASVHRPYNSHRSGDHHPDLPKHIELCCSDLSHIDRSDYNVRELNPG